PYDEAAARIYAKNRETCRGSGHPLSTEDGMIASICLIRGAKLATRNLNDFAGLGLDLVNPWDHRV
ncbi:MAG TPA: VapC toxin family PIN domain ribonuclease, partial [Micrococcaceae bacterium]